MTTTHRFWVNDADKVNQKEEKKLCFVPLMSKGANNLYGTYPTEFTGSP
jgi:hypothetical protein